MNIGAYREYFIFNQLNIVESIDKIKLHTYLIYYIMFYSQMHKYSLDM